LIRILSRLYDSISGQVFIDDHASNEYRVKDLHNATAILSQDTKLYPLSLSENIGLGWAASFSNMETIMEAAKEGGALEVIQKLNKRIDAVLDPLAETFSMNLHKNRTHPLYAEMEKIKKFDVSGGERQRLSA
jgi:ABC-type multidrug transport system fused ATPase/permease subunit